MPEDYKKVVLTYYEERITNGSLSPNLLDPTPGSLREECIYIYRKRRSSKDDEIIRSFFGDTDQECLDLLEKSFAIKFRQLPKILKGEVENPSVKYIELIAWLIDFNPRPSTTYYMSFHHGSPLDKEDIVYPKIENKQLEEIGDGEKVEINSVNNEKEVIKEDSGKNVKEESQSKEKTKVKKSKVRSAIVAFILIATTGGGVYLSSINRKKCMYWTGNNYEATGCDIVGDTPIIALDEYKLAHLKRITKPDTLTLKDVGKVWYVKIKIDSPEFYTDSGVYPLDTNKVLKPLTQYILQKYVLRK